MDNQSVGDFGFELLKGLIEKQSFNLSEYEITSLHDGYGKTIGVMLSYFGKKEEYFEGPTLQIFVKTNELSLFSFNDVDKEKAIPKDSIFVNGKKTKYSSRIVAVFDKHPDKKIYSIVDYLQETLATKEFDYLLMPRRLIDSKSTIHEAAKIRYKRKYMFPLILFERVKTNIEVIVYVEPTIFKKCGNWI